jgi:hypothetical protein
MKTILILSLLLAAPAFAAPPEQVSVATVLGPKLFRDGDTVEIADVSATSPRLEQGDTVVVKGRVRLDSRDSAVLCLFLTQTQGDGKEETDVTQRLAVSKGLRKFELRITIKHKGVLHLTLYDVKTGRPFGGTYFGTANQMKDIKDWDLSYYLKD